jgi:hypothetical protein
MSIFDRPAGKPDSVMFIPGVKGALARRNSGANDAPASIF